MATWPLPLLERESMKKYQPLPDEAVYISVHMMNIPKEEFD